MSHEPQIPTRRGKQNVAKPYPCLYVLLYFAAVYWYKVKNLFDKTKPRIKMKGFQPKTPTTSVAETFPTHPNRVFALPTALNKGRSISYNKLHPPSTWLIAR